MLNLLLAAVIASIVLATPVAHAQVARSAGDAGGPAAFASADGPKTCKGTVKGKRWYLVTSTPVTVGVVDVRQDGSVKRQTVPGLKADSAIFGSRNITGGQLTDNDPAYGAKHPNRCFVLGTIEIAKGHTIQIQNGFISRGGTIQGICILDFMHFTHCSLTRH